MDDLGGADKEFISEEVQKIVDDSIHQVFGIKENENTSVNVLYTRDKVTQWTNQIIDYTIRNLSKLGKPFKYIVTCIIQQNNGAKFTLTSGAHCDTSNDGSLFVQKEINDIIVLVSIFAMLI